MGDRQGGHASGSDDVYAKFTFGAAVLFLGLELAYVLSAQTFSFVKPSIDAFGTTIGRDFINTWMGGRSAFSGGPAPWFDSASYNTVLHSITDRADFPLHYWSYPPHLVLFIWPLGLLPYLPAYVLWCLVGLALYLLAAWSGGLSRKYLLFVAAAPGVAVNIFFGHNGFLTAALLIGGLAGLDRRPIVSGILFGVLTVKPQLGLLLPVMLAITGRWRVMAVAAASAAVLAVATAIWFGTDIWCEFVRKVVPQQHRLLVDAGDFGWPMVASAFVNARLIGVPYDWAWAWQAVSSCCALAMVVWAYWRRRDSVLSLALFVTATFLFSPWVLNYDMVVFGFIVARLRERADNTVADHVLALAVWALPLAMMPLGVAHIPAAVLVLPAFAARLIWRLAREDARHSFVAGMPVAAARGLLPQQ